MQKILFFLLSACFCGLSFAQEKIIRNPKLSPDAKHLAFSYAGDIWVYDLGNNQARRLTVNQAYDANPIWSPKGNEIVFSSNRRSYVDVFKVNVQGGVPEQLSFYPSTDIPSDWTSEGMILFASSRIAKGPERELELFGLDQNGGTPDRIMGAFGYAPVASPDGNLIAFEKGYCRISREDYDGPAQRDIYVYNRNTDTYHQITTSTKNDHSPQFDAQGNLYFVSAESGRYNIHKVRLNPDGSSSGAVEVLTQEKENGVIEYTIAQNKVIYNSGFTLKDLSGKELVVNIQTDYTFDLNAHKEVSRGMSDYAISPNGKQIAFELDGEIFVKQNDKEKSFSNNVSKSDARDQSPQWISDTELVFVSDREGQSELYLVKSADSLVSLNRSLKLRTTKLTESAEDVSSPSVSPDLKKIGYQVGRGQYFIAHVKDGYIDAPQLFVYSWTAPRGVSWSPDSKYIAYSEQDLDFDAEVFIQSSSEPADKYNVSMHPRSDYSPQWSPDGKKLAFVSNRNGNRNGSNYDVWMVFLQESDWEKTASDYEEGSYYSEDKTDYSKEVKIDTENIFDRVVQVTRLPDNEGSPVFAPDSEYIYYTATNPVNNRSNLYKVKWSGKSGKEIKGASNIYGLSLAGKSMYLMSASGLNQLNPKTDKLSRRPYKAIYDIDFKARNAQIFDEGVRALGAGFYDPQFHGYDWDKLVKTYRPWALQASTKQDFSYVYNLMLGQLNASHMGYRGSTPERTSSDRIGLLGVEVKNVSQGYEIEYILPKTVADKSFVKLQVGDVITHINGDKVKEDRNFYSYFRNQLGREMLIRLNDDREFVLRTESASKERMLSYDNWVNERKKMVDKFSNGRLGYIHIRGMDLPSFESFERELKAAGYGKEGLVIDVRFNGGGWTTDRLMAVLNVQQHAYTVPRGAARNLEKENKKFTKHYPFNERAILSVNTKPVVALCNEFSYSNAEIFSHAFKSLELGALVGQPTFGAVISTGGQSLLDGYVRMPFRAWYVKDSGLNMENGPAVPDYLVKNAPDANEKGTDAQLQKAVSVLLESL